MSYKVRSLTKEAPFWSTFGLWFAFEPVIAREVGHADPTFIAPTSEAGDSDSNLAFVFIATRRPESVNWMVPEEDIDLLSGAGAGGTSSPKSDETFEMLLMMRMVEIE